MADLVVKRSPIQCSMSEKLGAMTPAWLCPEYTHRLVGCPIWHRGFWRSWVEITGICSSLPPWMISNGVLVFRVNDSGSLADRSADHDGTVNGFCGMRAASVLWGV